MMTRLDRQTNLLQLPYRRRHTVRNFVTLLQGGVASRRRQKPFPALAGATILAYLPRLPFSLEQHPCRAARAWTVARGSCSLTFRRPWLLVRPIDNTARFCFEAVEPPQQPNVPIQTFSLGHVVVCFVFRSLLKCRLNRGTKKPSTRIITTRCAWCSNSFCCAHAVRLEEQLPEHICESLTCFTTFRPAEEKHSR